MEALKRLEWERWDGRIDSLWYWRQDGLLKNFQGMDGQAYDYLLYAKVRLLELMGDRPNNCQEMGGMVNDYCRGCFESPICMCIDFCSEDAKFLIKLVFEVFHVLYKVFINNKQVGISDVVNCLNLVRYHLSYGCVCKADCRVVWVYTINISLVWYEVYAPPEYIC